MSHDLGKRVLPNLVCKVQGKIFLGTSRILGKHARNHCGAVGGDDGLLGQMLRKLGIKLDLLLWLLSDGLDDKVCIPKGLIPVSGELQVRIDSLDLIFKLVELLGSNVLLCNKTVSICLGICLYSLKGIEVDLLKAIDLRLRTADRGIAAKPDSGLITHVSGLKRNLASKNAATGNGYFPYA